ncbi:uncharacterized WD repeat-containing protein alr3466-like [Lineus longissimus]|uniref:uncharacterized WD repeat-containing protein alr3466-like n=1 Tax=Lineus longissimus TaxID=88925 RepID=UPI002B4CE9D1
MARRRLEAALQVSRSINKESEWKKKFEKDPVIKKIEPDFEKEGIFSLQFSYDGEILAAGYGNFGVQVFDASNGKPMGDAVKSRYGGLATTCIRFNPKHQNVLYAASSEGTVHACDLSKGHDQLIIEEKGNEINCLDFSLDGYSFATAGKDLNVRLYDSQTNQLLKTFKGYSPLTQAPDNPKAGHAMRIFALKYHPEYNQIFVTAGWDSTLKIWDARANDGVVRSIKGPHICGDSLDIRGYRILTGSWVANHALQLWDYTEGKLLKDIPFPHGGAGEFLYTAQFLNDICVIAGGSGTNSVQVISSDTNECLGTIEMGNKPVQALDTTLGGARIAVGSGDSIVKLVSLA